MQKSLWVAVAATVLWLSWGKLAAQSVNGSLDGYLPKGRYTVTLSRPDVGYARDLKVENAERFHFEGLTPGVYSVHVFQGGT